MGTSLKGTIAYFFPKPNENKGEGEKELMP